MGAKCFRANPLGMKCIYPFCFRCNWYQLPKSKNKVRSKFSIHKTKLSGTALVKCSWVTRDVDNLCFNLNE